MSRVNFNVNLCLTKIHLSLSHTYAHTLNIYTQSQMLQAAQVLASCHTASWLRLPWVTFPPAVLCGSVGPAYRVPGWRVGVEVIVPCLYTSKETALTSKERRENTWVLFKHSPQEPRPCLLSVSLLHCALRVLTEHVCVTESPLYDRLVFVPKETGSSGKYLFKDDQKQ